MKYMIILILLLINLFIFADIAYIDSVSREISADSLYDILYKLSGEQPYPSGYYSWNRFCLLEGADTAANYLRTKLNNYGLDSVFFQYYTDTIDEYASVYGDSIYSSQNVVALKRGRIYSDSCIVIGAHYDCSSYPEKDITTKSPGVDDNGSGTAAIIEMSRIISGLETDYDVYLVCFNAEEVGLQGASKFLYEYIIPNNLYVKTMINMDMIGYTVGGRGTYIKGYPNEVKELGVAIGNEISNNSFTEAGGSFADADPYYNEGITAAMFIEDDYTLYPGYHKDIDSVSYIVSDFYWDNVRSAFGLMFYLANSPSILNYAEVIDNGDSTVSMNWNSATEGDINHYKAYYKLLSDSNYMIIDSISMDSTSFTLCDLIIDSIYVFSISSVDSEGYEGFRYPQLLVIPTYRPNPPTNIEIACDSINIYLNYSKCLSADIDFYNIYRKKASESYIFLGSTVDTFFIDSTISDTMIYTYSVTCVDNDSLESNFSEEISSRLIKLFNYLIVIDETKNSTLSTDAKCDAFYDSIFDGYNHRMIDADSLDIIDILMIANFARTIIIDDDLSESKIDSKSIEAYIENGGKLMLLGWNLGKVITGNTDDNPVYPDSTIFAGKTLGINSYFRNGNFDMDYFHYNINGDDTVRFSSIKLPRGSGGNLNYSGIFALNKGIEIGFYHSLSGDTAFNDKNMLFSTEDSNCIIVNAPLFSMEYNDAKNMIGDLLELWEVYIGITDEIAETDKFIKIYPIQTADIQLKITGFNKNENITVKIYDINGRCINKKEFKISEDNYYLENKGIVPGIYFVKVQLGNYSKTGKIILLK